MPNDYKKYELLEEKFEYDKEAATQLAEATSELVEVQRRAEYLKDVVARHSKLKRFLWGTLEGKVIAFHDLETDHLINILKHLENRGDEPSKELQAEARSRGLEIKGNNGLASLTAIVRSIPAAFTMNDGGGLEEVDS